MRRVGKVPAVGTYMVGRNKDSRKFDKYVIRSQVIINATGQKKGVLMR